MARRHWLDILLAPLTLLARARGRWRLLLLAGYALILAVVGVLAGREAVLWKIPDAPEPFDLARYGHVDLPDAANAMVLYRRADRLRVPMPELFRGLPPGAGDAWSWGQLDPRVAPWVEANRPALDLWREGTARPDSLFAQPADFSSRLDPDFGVFDGLARLAQLATLEATRRQAAGDLVGAWADHRAVIRSALHAGRHGGLAATWAGDRILQKARPGLAAWADAQGMTPALLRGALADLRACRALGTTNADILRVEYFRLRADLADRDAWERRQLRRGDRDVPWGYHFPAVLAARYFWDNEPKRSRKILRLIALGQLAQCDRPIAARPPVVSTGYLIYARDAITPAPLDRIAPERLAAWADASGCRDFLVEPGFILGATAAARGQLDALRLRLAEQAYALEHDGRPAATCGDLLGPYLDALPEGVAPGDPAMAP